MEPKRIENTFQKCKDLLLKNRMVQSTVVFFSLYIGRNIYYWLFRKYYNMPPGPNGIPFFGVFFNMVYDYKYQIKMADKYGPIMSLPFFGSGFVFINNASIVKQILPNKQFLNRDDTNQDQFRKSPWKSLWSVGDENTLPIISINGENWVKRRKFGQCIFSQ